MAKNRNKKKNDSAAMDINFDRLVTDAPRAMDTSESAVGKPYLGASNNRKIKKGVQMKRTKNVRKMKALAKAISLNEKSAEKVLKSEVKESRTKSAKKLYD